ncbi:MAG: 2-oxoacid:acceptor oxidoreductase subunit alpha [Candidatus Thorarchaeota archaeon]|nr:2-oxoacid:acceptor oxidoreductase subunit alpha [Candidatus Thorarchaeota archaeon]
MTSLKKGISIVLSGAAGQGIATVEDFFVSILKRSGYNVFSTREFMSRIRGGTNSTQIRVGDGNIYSYSEQSDIVIPLNKRALPHLSKYGRINDSTLVVGEAENIISDVHLPANQILEVPFTAIAEEVGGRIYSNTVAVGLLAAVFDVDEDIATDYLTERFESKGEDIVNDNIEAYRQGHEIGVSKLVERMDAIDVTSDESVRDHMLINGGEAVGLGAIAGGCNFISSYPMSPSTAVLVFLSNQSQEFGIVVDQAESEISAINKGLGAWYAGSRAMVTTSGGGFALMVEGLSLAGMIESPMVIHLAQRPGPATGLPTRTEQGDLLFALRAGHGEFPRIILAPGTFEDGFHLTQKAFNLADEYQVPVIVLTDQYLMDSHGNIPVLDLSDISIEKHVQKTTGDYTRYKMTDSGVSPRGIPGYGDGLVVADSDEHDEAGHITEDLDLRIEMVEKRMKKKLELLREAAIPPEYVGPEEYDALVVAWGTNYNVVVEALERVGRDDIGFLHFKQVFPLHKSALKYLDDADRLALVENSSTAQFATVLANETGYRIPEENRLLKYNGLPFSVEEVTRFLEDF